MFFQGCRAAGENKTNKTRATQVLGVVMELLAPLGYAGLMLARVPAREFVLSFFVCVLFFCVCVCFCLRIVAQTAPYTLLRVFVLVYFWFLKQE